MTNESASSDAGRAAGSTSTLTAPPSDAVVPLSPLVRDAAHFEPAISAAVERVVRSGYYIGGPEVNAFTDAFAAYCGVSHCIGVGNGTDALEIALRAVGVESSHQVITVGNAGGYSATATMSIGAVPFYVDIREDTHLMDPSAIAAALTSQTKAVVVTHLYGAPVDVTAVRAAIDAAASWGIPIIEDCAQAHGATLYGRRVGSLGDIATFSFYPTKNLGALGDGGAVVTNDPRLAERAAALAQYGWVSERYNIVVPGGRNSRLDPIQAAVLAVKLPELDEMNARRRAIAARYATAIGASEDVRLLHADLPADRASVFHLAVLVCTDRQRVDDALHRAGIQTTIHYPIPDHQQTALRSFVGCGWGGLDVTERAAGQILTIPCHPMLTDGEVQRVCDALAAVVGGARE